MTETLAPVLRVQDADAAIRWYERLGFNMDFQHSAESSKSPATPPATTAVVKRGELVLVLSNSENDAPRSAAVVYLRVTDIAPIADEFKASIQTIQGGAL